MWSCACASEMYDVFLPMTIASSTSQSVFLEFFGIMRSSFGPMSADVALKNTTGWRGAWSPASSAWSE